MLQAITNKLNSATNMTPYVQELHYLAGQYVELTVFEVERLARVARHEQDGELTVLAKATGGNVEAAQTADAASARDTLRRHVLPVTMTAAREWTPRFGDWRSALEAAFHIADLAVPNAVITRTGVTAGTLRKSGWNPQLTSLMLHGWVRMALAVEMVKAAQRARETVDTRFIEMVSFAKKAVKALLEEVGNRPALHPELWVARSSASKISREAASAWKGRRNVLPVKGRAPAYAVQAASWEERVTETDEGDLISEMVQISARTVAVKGGRYTQKWVRQQPLIRHVVRTADVRLRLRRDREITDGLKARAVTAAARTAFWDAVPAAGEKAEESAFLLVTGKRAVDARAARRFTPQQREQFNRERRRAFSSILSRSWGLFRQLLTQPGWTDTLLGAHLSYSTEMIVGEDGDTTVGELMAAPEQSAEGYTFRAQFHVSHNAELLAQVHHLPGAQQQALMHANLPQLAVLHRKAQMDVAAQQRWVRVCDDAGLHPSEAAELASAALKFAGARFAARLSPEMVEALKVFIRAFRQGDALPIWTAPRTFMPVTRLVREYRRYGQHYSGEAESLFEAACRRQGLGARVVAQLVTQLPIPRSARPRRRRTERHLAGREFVQAVQKHGERQVRLLDPLALELGQEVTALRQSEWQAANELLALAGEPVSKRMHPEHLGAPVGRRLALETAQVELIGALEQLERATNCGFVLLVAAAELEADRAVQHAHAALRGDDWLTALEFGEEVPNSAACAAD